MTRRISRVAIAVAIVIAALAGSPTRPRAQGAAAMTLDGLLAYPFPQHLIASPVGSAVAWVSNERGVRNILVAEAPAFKARRLTAYTADDGQELTQLAFSSDGRFIVYVRGGNHDGSESMSTTAPNPTASPIAARIQVWVVAVASGEARPIGDGDSPAVAADGHRVAFVRDGQLFVAGLDGSAPAEAIAVNGISAAPAWSPDGRTLAFESQREGHTLIALFTDVHQPIRYLAPSTSRDGGAVWSPDGGEIAFIRQPGRTVKKNAGAFEREPWAIWIADVRSESAREIWKSGVALPESLPRVSGGPNLHWGAANRIVFLSYRDGWPHLYSLPTGGGEATLLTPGQFMVEQMSLAPDRRSIVYTANSGAEPDDLERRHLFKVPVDAARSVQLTSGRGIEWGATVTADGKTIAYLASDARRPPRPMILPIDGGTPRGLADESLPSEFPSSLLVEPEPVSLRPGSLPLRGQLFKSAQGPARRPAVLFVHGGPAQQMLLGWHYAEYYAHAYAINQFLAARGFIVMAVNYRLGIGYGHAFQYPDEASRGETPDYDDVIAAAGYLQMRPDVDRVRVGIWGGSYGGYLTALALARDSSMFSAGVDLHGVHDRVIKDLETMTFPTLDDMSDTSPVWSSPVLLIHGDDDRTVPFQQTIDLEARLRDKGVMVDVLTVPDDVHDFLLYRSWRSIASAMAAYLDRTVQTRPQ
jgi:dipeptidyl aminopeptidase/acylaminoacyl peptidase